MSDFFYHILKNFLVLNPFLQDPDPYRFCQDPDPYRFCQDPDPYQTSHWIRIRNEFFHILDPDTDPPHCMKQETGERKQVHLQ